MEKSKYGKELIYLWKGCLSSEQLSVKEVPSTLNIGPEEIKQIKFEFEEAKRDNPHFFDGTLWRYEGLNFVKGGVDFLVSPTTYMPHNIRRHKEDLPISEYVNPFCVDSLQETVDNYLLIGVKGEIADQKGLGSMGAGFFNRKVEGDKTLPPGNLFLKTQAECWEETSYEYKLYPNDIETFRALGLTWGSNHDSSMCMYVPLQATKNDVGIGNKEHSDLFFLKTDNNSLNDFLNNGGMKGIPAVDHLLGNVELYLNAKKNGILNESYRYSNF